MNPSTDSEFSLLQALAAAGVALVYIMILSRVREPHRQQWSAIILAGAGAAYLSGGLGLWEFGFCGLMTFVAFRGLSHYYAVGIGWLLHTGWDLMHHSYGNPIIPFVPSSSAGCAVCDSILVLWYFFKAPSLTN